jgi:hypothetical protein
LGDLTVGVFKTSSIFQVSPEKRELGAEAVERHWRDLAGPEAGPAYLSARALGDSPRAAADFLRTQLVPITLEGVERLVTKLNDDDPAVRDSAARMLQVAGTPELLEKILERHPPLETTLRIKSLMAAGEKSKSLSPEEIRVLRAIGVLEQAATEPAREILQRLAAGFPSARQTRAAREALERLRLRGSP